MKFYIPSASPPPPPPVDKTWSNSLKEIVEFTHYEIATDRFAFSLSLFLEIPRDYKFTILILSRFNRMTCLEKILANGII